jgi:hypothetical protein
MCVTNCIPLGRSLLLPVGTVNPVQTRKARAPGEGMELHPDRLDDIGATVDLPHHHATEGEVDGLLAAFSLLLQLVHGARF